VGNMMSVADTMLTSTLYNGEHKRLTWKVYVRIHTEEHASLNDIMSMANPGLITIPWS
jgi:hypothetical protein